MSEPIVELQVKSDAYRLISLFLHLPTKELWAGVADGSVAADAQAIVSELGMGEDAVADMAGFADAGVSLDGLRADYTALYTSPSGPKVPIYEAIFRDRDDFDTSKLTFISPNALSAERFYRSYGLKMGGTDNNSADHMAAECEFASFLLAEQASAVEACDAARALKAAETWSDFQVRHLAKWSEAFFGRSLEAARTPAYRAVAKLGALLSRM
ncbi:Uncharacterized component of anaerobic dehydrogenases [Slackia heliotrinireducens]|uniref:Uncharacterized component of anaerobic dehydrogenase n=1 Tax=Slackia heliotrinireducens (strain ATCC 29202 / DSM 20476 / NCTC 11029 / RHS 1) TaxID=471855 RepID=C7N7C4_SLAHD|nr:molecular chaperone TorD family protein [Slackia heliotrinireducens]ACV22809.1 uncharacterized component of anaerobic dehydrogenase [Slackia heliotrinireducens DSM 20476]VEH01520.1 Uncharacterized component of anaerobic dehydrogenases [Slackia heliotrinireducens]